MVAESGFHTFCSHEIRRIGKCGIAVAVGAHVIKRLDIVAHTGQVARQFFQVAARYIVHHPRTRIVQARRIAVGFAVAVAHPPQIVCEVAPRGAVFGRSVSQCEHGLHKCGAVERVKIYRERLRRMFESAARIWGADELPCKPFHIAGALLFAFLHENTGDARGVRRLVGKSYRLPVGGEGSGDNGDNGYSCGNKFRKNPGLYVRRIYV